MNYGISESAEIIAYQKRAEEYEWNEVEVC